MFRGAGWQRQSVTKIVHNVGRADNLNPVQGPLGKAARLRREGGKR